MAVQGFVSLDTTAFIKLIIGWLLAFFSCIVIAILRSALSNMFWVSLALLIVRR